MRTSTVERKNQRLVARVTRTHKQLFERAAAMQGVSLANFVVAHALEAAHQLISDQKLIRLNSEQSRRFAEALLAKPRSVPGALRRTRRAYREQVVRDS